MKKLLVTVVLFFLFVPATSLADSLADGRIDYRAKCVKCHGTKALMAIRTARKLNIDIRKLALMASKMSRVEMIAITEKGKDKMPGFEKELTKEQIAGIVDYIFDQRGKRDRRQGLVRMVGPGDSLKPPMD